MPPVDYLNRRAKRVMLASAARVHAQKNSAQRSTAKPWQTRAYEYYDQIGEVRNAARYFGNSFSKLDLVAQERNTDGEWEQTQNTAVLAQLERWAGDKGSYAGLLGSYGVQQFIAGRSYLTVTVEKLEDGEAGAECWEMLSPVELRVKDKGYERMQGDEGRGEQYDDPADPASLMPGEAIVYDLWNPHPAFAKQADSPLRPMLDVCEEIVLLTRRVRSEVVSRLASAGILFLPESASFPGTPDCPDDDADCDPLINMLVEAATKAIEDEGSASALLPILARMPDELIDKFKLLEFNPNRAAGYPEIALRTEAIHRLAQGVDLPAEILLGLGQSNHWTGWLVTEEAWKAYLQPTAERMVTDLTAIVFRPNLEVEGVEDASIYRVWYDEAKLVVRPDRSKDATLAFDRGAITWEGLRQLMGIPDGLAADEAEQALIADWMKSTRGGGAPTGDTSGGGASSTDQQPPTNGASASPERETILAAAAELAVERCVELAGSRLRTKVRGTGHEAVIDNVANADVYAVLGGDVVASFGYRGDGGALRLVSGGSACFAPVLERWGVEADDRTTILMEVEQRAAQRLRRPSRSDSHGRAHAAPA